MENTLFVSYLHTSYPLVDESDILFSRAEIELLDGAIRCSQKLGRDVNAFELSRELGVTTSQVYYHLSRLRSKHCIKIPGLDLRANTKNQEGTVFQRIIKFFAKNGNTPVTTSEIASEIGAMVDTVYQTVNSTHRKYFSVETKEGGYRKNLWRAKEDGKLLAT